MVENNTLWRVVAVVCGFLAGGAVLTAGIEGFERSPSAPVGTILWLGSIVIGVVVWSYVGSLRR